MPIATDSAATSQDVTGATRSYNSVPVSRDASYALMGEDGPVDLNALLAKIERTENEHMDQLITDHYKNMNRSTEQAKHGAQEMRNAARWRLGGQLLQGGLQTLGGIAGVYGGIQGGKALTSELRLDSKIGHTNSALKDINAAEKLINPKLADASDKLGYLTQMKTGYQDQAASLQMQKNAVGANRAQSLQMAQTLSSMGMGAGALGGSVGLAATWNDAARAEAEAEKTRADTQSNQALAFREQSNRARSDMANSRKDIFNAEYQANQAAAAR